MTSALCLALAVSLAQGASPRLEPAEQAFAQKRYEDVLPSLETAREGGLSRDEQVRAFELEAMTYAAFDQSAKAIDAFKKLLRLSPSWEPSRDVSPKVRGLYESARLEVPRPAPPPRWAQSPPEPPKPVYQRAWFWAGVGVVVAGAVAAGVVVSQPHFPDGKLGRTDIP